MSTNHCETIAEAIRPQQPSTHTYRLFDFLKNRCRPAAKKRDYDQLPNPCQAFRESFLTPRLTAKTRSTAQQPPASTSSTPHTASEETAAALKRCAL
jgi:hypothetical protein